MQPSPDTLSVQPPNAYADAPPKFSHIQIETTTACNAKCLMCPRDKATRSTHAERMDTDVFWRTVDQAIDLGVTTILPFIDGEPLSDPRMVDFVEGIHKRGVTVGWYTNGSLLTEAKARRLLPCITGFNVSMQGGDKETYEKVMGLPWERTIANVDRLIEINNELGRPAQIRANMCVFGPTAHTAEAFRERWESKGALVCLGSYSNFGGLGKDKLGETPWRDAPRLVCTRATQHLYVYWDGTVGQCCFDLIASVKWGNMHTQTLREVISSDPYREMRRAHFDLDIKAMPPICRACNACKFHG